MTPSTPSELFDDPQQAVREAEATESAEDAQKDRPALLTKAKDQVGRWVRQRWDRLKKEAKDLAADLKVNYLRYRGHPFVQRHPEKDNEIWLPRRSDRRTPPTINKIERSLDRYVSQVTADEPVIEGVPSSTNDDDRDAAEAATHALQGEWHRMRLQSKLQRAMWFAGVFRSGFWFFEWDEQSGNEEPAQKYVVEEDEDGHKSRELKFVDEDGNPVESEDDAATIWEGNLRVEVMTPMNVRWTGGESVHEADEVMVAKLVTLRNLYETVPETKDMEIEDLVTDVPNQAEEWLQDLRGGEFTSGPEDVLDEDNPVLNRTGESIPDTHSVLDQKVFLMHYFRPESSQYEDGLHAVIAGNSLVHRGPLRWGVIPVAQFKMLEGLADALGRSLVDILKDPQELLDFVNSQILKHLQMMRRRYFVPTTSNVSARELKNPTESIITYNPQADPPTPEQQPEIPQSLTGWMEQFEETYNDQVGLHGLSKGKHVPGVSSGRHAEALKEADTTLLGLTRQQIKEATVQTGRIILAAIQEEWTRARKVRYLGQDRAYVERHFSGADFEGTEDVRLREGTLLMLTPSQKAQTLFSYAEMGAITPQELRRLAPITDTAGIELSEDNHYQRARRQNERFLQGPPEELVQSFEDAKVEAQRAQRSMRELRRAGAEAGAGDPELEAQAQAEMQSLQQHIQEIQQEWQETLSKFVPEHRSFEDDPRIARVHAEEHARALSRRKVERFPQWWVDAFEQHAVEEAQIAGVIQPPQPEGQPGQGQGQGQGQRPRFGPQQGRTQRAGQGSGRASPQATGQGGGQ